MTQTKIAIIGAGMIGQKHIARALADPSIDLVGIADPSDDAKQRANAIAVPYFADHKKLFDNTAVDGAIVATPNVLHVPVGLDCARRGIHILVEKPIAETVSAANELVTAAQRAQVALLVGHHRRHHPSVRKAKEIIESGQIGRLVAVSAIWATFKPDDYFNESWRRQAGGGPILINLIHDIDSLRFICGEIASVQAQTSHATRQFEVEDSAALLIRFANGALATIITTDSSPSPWNWEMGCGENVDFYYSKQNVYHFMGSDGGLAFPNLELWTYRDPQSRGWYEQLHALAIKVNDADPWQAQLTHFCAVIKGQETPIISGVDGTRTLATALAVKQAADSASMIKLEPD